MTFALVSVGASLGGLRALQTVLKAFPADFPAAVTVIQHRSADKQGPLAEVLQASCALPVIEAEDKMILEPGRVYLAPADYHLLLDRGAWRPEPGGQPPPAACRGWFSLSTGAPVNYARPSIDVFFQSAAEAYGAAVIGVLLSGANEDGAQGLAAIKQRGGLTIAQDPKTARARAMPWAAITLNAADYILPLKEIGTFVVEFRGQPGRPSAASIPNG
jgi:two-component system, chemotaxis family, protein-glutamate methylesterase/glutaminase